MSETRKIAAILVSDVVGYSRLAGADEERILARFGRSGARSASSIQTGAWSLAFSQPRTSRST